jgi:hypothetical protein
MAILVADGVKGPPVLPIFRTLDLAEYLTAKSNKSNKFFLLWAVRKLALRVQVWAHDSLTFSAMR